MPSKNQIINRCFSSVFIPMAAPSSNLNNNQNKENNHGTQ